MTQTPTPIHEVVREHYAERIKNNASCCGPSDCCSADSNLYPADLLATLPDGESAVSYGCGDPITLASLEPGQTVLDLGSGAGLDCFFAAKKVGETGKVIGVDMTPEMIEKAQGGAKPANHPMSGALAPPRITIAAASAFCFRPCCRSAAKKPGPSWSPMVKTNRTSPNPLTKPTVLR